MFQGPELANTISGEYRRFVLFPEELCEAAADTLALWTMHTWVTDAANHTAYIA